MRGRRRARGPRGVPGVSLEPRKDRTARTRLPSQDEKSAALASDVEAFLAGGNAVDEVESGVSGLDPKTGLPLGADPRKGRQITLRPPGKPPAVDWKKRLRDTPARRIAGATQRRRKRVSDKPTAEDGGNPPKPKQQQQPRQQTPARRRHAAGHRTDLTDAACAARARAVLAAAAAATRATLEEALTIKGRGRKTIGTRARQLAALVLDDQPDRYLVTLCSTARDRASNWRTIARANDDAEFVTAARRLREAAAGQPPWTALEALQREWSGEQGTVADARVAELRRWYDVALRVAEIETRAALVDLQREDGNGPRDPEHVQHGRALAARGLAIAGASYEELARLLGISNVSARKRCLLASTVPALEDAALEIAAFLPDTAPDAVSPAIGEAAGP